MTEKKRIVLNTVATYGRSLFALALGLFSSRWILLSLGQSDFGLYGVVGSLIVFITFINNVMSGAVGRFYAYSIGRGKTLGEQEAFADLANWFNTALSIHFFLMVLLFCVGMPLGEYAVKNWLVIPSDRMDACVWVFRLSIIATFTSVASVPYKAMFQAHQYIAELSVVGMLRSLVQFCFSYAILSVEMDRLIFYASFMTFIHVGFDSILTFWAMHKFRSCRILLKEWYDLGRMRQFFTFAGSKLLGGVCVLMRNEGGALLVNRYFSPVVNAACSISMQVTGHASSLSSALVGALQPAIAYRAGSKDRIGLLRYADATCRMASLLVILFSIPLLAEMQYVLELWLKNPPPDARLFCSVAIISLLVDKASVGYMLAANAYGEKIVFYEIVNGLLLMASFPLTLVVFHLGYGVFSMQMCLLATYALYTLARVNFCRWQMGVSVLAWIFKTAFPVGIVAGAAYLAGIFWQCVMAPSFNRLLLTTGTSFLVAIVTGWWFLIHANERQVLMQKFLWATGSRRS